MIRPSPNSSTVIKGIRLSNDPCFRHYEGLSNGQFLPINCGKEVSGGCLVVDFESTHFEGSLLVRIKGAKTHKGFKYQTDSYFDGKKRTFSAVVRGKFKNRLSMSHCFTGQMFDRPTGKVRKAASFKLFICFQLCNLTMVSAPCPLDRQCFCQTNVIFGPST